MNEQKLISTLESMGRSNKEARLYVALLKAGRPLTNIELADLSGVPRPTTYVILETLLRLKLATQQTISKKVRYTAAPPDRLEELVLERAERLAEQKGTLEKAMPYFRALAAMPQDSPTVQFYSGDEEIRGLLADLFHTKLKGGNKEVYGLSNVDNLATSLPSYAKELVKRDRVRAGIHYKLVYTSTKGATLRAKDKLYNRESRYLPPELYPVQGDIKIVGDYVILRSLGEQPFAVSIRNAGMAHDQRVFFQGLWEIAGQRPENQ